MQQLTDASRSDQLGDAGGGAGVVVGVADHQVQAGGLGGVDEVPGMARLEHHRLLDHHVQAGVERRLHQRVVVHVGDGDDHAVDVPG